MSEESQRMNKQYEIGYATGMKRGLFEGNLRALQVGLTAIITVGGLSLLERDDVSTIVIQEQVIEVPYTPELHDDVEPHKYNPNPSTHPEQSRG